MSETREQRIERWARALIELQIRRVRRHDTTPERLEAMLPASIDYAWPDKMPDAEAIDASNTAAGLVLVDRNVVMKVLHAWDDIYNHRTPTGPDLIHCLDALRKEIEG